MTLETKPVLWLPLKATGPLVQLLQPLTAPHACKSLHWGKLEGVVKPMGVTAWWFIRCQS